MNLCFEVTNSETGGRRQHKALSTEETYVYWLRRYMAALSR